MKTLLTLCALFTLGSLALADIQDPPMADMGPTRKLGRGIGNLLYGITELPHTMCVMNDNEGNAAAASYGVVKGIGRVFFRMGVGVYEIATFPIPTYRCSYRPPYRSRIPWVNGGYNEFPPELGWETRRQYSTP